MTFLVLIFCDLAAAYVAVLAAFVSGSYRESGDDDGAKLSIALAIVFQALAILLAYTAGMQP